MECQVHSSMRSRLEHISCQHILRVSPISTTQNAGYLQVCITKKKLCRSCGHPAGLRSESRAVLSRRSGARPGALERSPRLPTGVTGVASLGRGILVCECTDYFEHGEFLQPQFAHHDFDTTLSATPMPTTLLARHSDPLQTAADHLAEQNKDTE